MGSVRLPNLSINSSYLYYKNILNSNLSFWHYYYFFFFFSKIINYIFMDGILINFSKNKFNNVKLKQIDFFKNDFHVGSYHLYKIQKWFVIYIYLFNRNLKNNVIIKSNTIDLNLKKIYLKNKMNYKFLIKNRKNEFMYKYKALFV